MTSARNPEVESVASCEIQSFATRTLRDSSLRMDESTERRFLLDRRSKRELMKSLQDDLDNYKIIFAPVRRTPPEILEKIFVLCISPRFNSLSTLGIPWVISHVCRKWRNIAMASPPLWSSVNLFIQNWNSDAKEKRAILLSMYLSRSAGHLLDIRLYNCGSPGSHNPVFPPLLATVFRWRSLRISASDPYQNCLLPVSGCFQSLRRLSILWTKEEHGISGPENSIFNPLQAQDDIELFHPKHIDLDLPWTKISELYVTDPYYTTLMKKASCASTCRIRLVEPTITIESPITFPHIQELQLPVEEGDECDATSALNNISLPALKHFTLHVMRYSALLIVADFLNRSGCLLESISAHFGKCIDYPYHEFHLDDEIVEAFLRSLPESLISCVFEKVEVFFADVVMRMLASDQNLLPKMKVLRLDYQDPIWEWEQQKRLKASRPHLIIESLW